MRDIKEVIDDLAVGYKITGNKVLLHAISILRRVDEEEIAKVIIDWNVKTLGKKWRDLIVVIKRRSLSKEIVKYLEGK